MIMVEITAADVEELCRAFRGQAVSLAAAEDEAGTVLVDVEADEDTEG